MHALRLRAVLPFVIAASVACGDHTNATPGDAAGSSLTIVRRTPEPGTEGVYVRAPITVEMSAPLHGATVTDASVRLTDGQGRHVEAERDLSEDGRTLTVRVTGPVWPPDTLTLELTSDLTDRAQGAFEGDAWSWHLPPWIEHGEHVNTEDTVVVDASSTYDAEGRLVVAFFERGHDDNAYLHVKRWEGGAWSTLGAGALNHDIPASTLTDAVELVTTAEGALFVVWTEGGTRLYMSRWTGTGWASVGGGTLDDEPSYFVEDLRSAEDPLGRPVISWRDTTAAYGALRVLRWTEGDQVEWLSQALLTGIHLFDHTLHGAGDEVAVVHDTGAFPPTELNAFRWDETQGDFTSMAGATGILNVDQDADAVPFVARSDDHGALFVTWAERGEQLARIYARGWNGQQLTVLGSGWLNEDASVDAYGPARHTELDMTLDPQGRPVVVWGEGGYDNDSVETRWYAKRWTGSAWSLLGGEPFRVHAQPMRIAALRADGDGRPMVLSAITELNGQAYFVDRFDGASWDTLGAAVEAGTVESGRLVILPDGAPAVFAVAGPHLQGSVHARAYDEAGTWRDLRGDGLPRNHDHVGEVLGVPRNAHGTPALVWREGEDPNEGYLHAMQLNR